VRSVLRRFPPLKFWKQQSWNLQVKTSFERELLLLWLSEEGYEYRELVCGPGEYSARGGIVDIYPRHSSFPIRVELFGDEVDSLRIFDLVTQRSTARLERFSLLPGNEDHLAHVARSGALRCLSVGELSGKYLVIADEPEEMRAEADRFCPWCIRCIARWTRSTPRWRKRRSPRIPPFLPKNVT
jgi:transcription-repair coupling factor (superfamily II helicase)